MSGSAFPGCASGPRACAPTRGGSRAPAARSHAHLADGAHFDRAVGLEDGAAARQLGGVVEALRADEEVAADQVLRLGVRPVGDQLLLAGEHLAADLQRLARLEVAGLGELLDPVAPLLHLLLHLLRAGGGQAAAEDIEVIGHRRLRFRISPACLHSMTIARARPGHFFGADARNAEGPKPCGPGPSRQAFGKRPLNRLHVLRLQALRPLGDVEADLLAFSESAETLGGDGRVVAEDVLATIVLRDETKALRIVEPLHGTSRHSLLSGCWRSVRPRPPLFFTEGRAGCNRSRRGTQAGIRQLEPSASFQPRARD